MKDTDIKKIKDIVQRAKSALNKMESGKEYPTHYVVDKFIKASQKHPTDQLIGNMRDVLIKRCSHQSYFSQKELSDCYDRMYGLGGGQTAFRSELGEFLLQNRQLEKVAHAGSSRRTRNEEKAVTIDRADEGLTNAFASIFDLGNDNSFGAYNPRDKKTVQKTVISILNTLGMQPNDVIISKTNEHFALATAIYNTNSLTKVAVHIPVQISDGCILTPNTMISDGEVAKLSRANLLVHLKMSENEVKASSLGKFASQHGSAAIQLDKVSVPASLKDYADLENELIAAASNFSRSQIMMATAMLSTEMKAAGVTNPQIKLASSGKNLIMFDVSIPTSVGRSIMHVPVEFHNNKPILPSKFASASGNKEIMYDFTYPNIGSFVKNAKRDDLGVKRARETGELKTMSYHQLVDRMIEGVSSKDYKLSEDALMSIQDKFGATQHKIAIDKFAELLKVSSSVGSARAQMIKQAFRNGDLINLKTSVEPYCPKLGLPLSKVDFDSTGRPYPKYRNKSLNNTEETLISSSRILFT